MKKVLLVLVGLMSSFVFAQTTTIYTMQTDNFNFLFTEKNTNPPYAGTYNNGATELAQYANGGSFGNTPGAAAFRTFTISGSDEGATARPLQVGDEFSITAFVANNPSAGGRIGISFRNSTTYEDFFNSTDGNTVARFQLDNTGNWKVYSGSTTVESTAGVNADRTLKIKITSSNTFNAIIGDVTYYNLSFATTGPILSFSIYTFGDNNPNSFWKSASLINSTTLEYGFNNSSPTVSGIISDGLISNSEVNLSINKVYMGGTGTKTFDATNTYTGLTQLEGGTLSISADENLGTAPGTVVADHLRIFKNSTLLLTETAELASNRGISLRNAGGEATDPSILSVASGKTLTYNGVISEEASGKNFRKSGAGTLILGGVSTFTGTTQLFEGVLTIGVNNALNSATELYIKLGASLNLNGYDLTVKSVRENGSGDGGTISLGVGTLTVAGGFAEPLYQNSISGTGNLVKQGTGILALYGTQSYTGTTTISGGAISTSVNLSSSTITVQSGGSFNITENVTVNDLTIESGGALNISSGKTLTVNGTLTINDKITLTDGNLKITTLSGASATNYFVTSGTGKVIMNIGATPKTFYVGPSTSLYNPVTVSNSGDAIDLGVVVKSSFTNTPVDANKVVNASWTLSNETGSGSPNVSLTLEWASTQHAASFTTSSNVYIGRYNSGWTDVSAVLTDLGSGRYSANASGFTSFSEFGVGNAGALPVELTSFSGKVVNGKVNLNWNTATEINNYGFEVERAKAVSGSQNVQFAKVGFVEGNGNSNSPKSYSFSDANVTAGKYIYRLKQIDTDGQFEYSQEVEVSVQNLINGYVLEQNYPNPFNPSTSIKFGFQNDTRAEVKVYNVIGAEVATLFNGMADAGRIYEVTFDASGLASGTYFYKLVTPDKTDVRKMILMK